MLRASLPSILKMRQQSAASVRPTQSLRCRQARIAIDLAISYVFGIDAVCLWSGTRGVRDIAEARQVAMYLAHVCCRMSLTEVGAMFGRDRTTVAHACLKVEYRRDNPNFDRALDVLGWALPTLVLRDPKVERIAAPLSAIEDHKWL
ncbi:MAG: helix-turn-helix domain-containing protein [Hyphomicrobium sp.]